MYTLYSRPGSGGFVVEAALTMAGAPFMLVDVAKNDVDDAFRKISPLGQVPVLTLADGHSITESAAMCLLVADLHPASGLAPKPDDPARPDFLRWIVFMSSVLYPALLRYFYAGRYTADPAAIPMVRENALAESDRAFAIIEAALAGRQWLAGDTMSIADVYLLMLACWHPVDDAPRAEWTGIVRHSAALKSLPVLAALNERHRLW